MTNSKNSPVKKKSYFSKLIKDIFKNYELYLFMLPGIAYFAIFHYGPMLGLQIALKDFRPKLGIWGSEWVGFKHFVDFFNSYMFQPVLLNTVYLSFYQLIATFFPPLILALLLNQLDSGRAKRFIQTVTYAPHFISIVVLVGMMYVFFSPTGFINGIIKMLGGEMVFFFGRTDTFAHMFVWSNVWQNMGWGAIVYLAALSSISPDLHEAAMMDGASKLQRIWHIEIPGIMPTAVVLLIINMGRVMNLGFEKAFLMQTPLNRSVAEIIATYTYQAGLRDQRFDYATAVGLFNQVINLVLILSVNRVAKKLNDSSLW